jgi:hypothetical protein
MSTELSNVLILSTAHIPQSDRDLLWEEDRLGVYMKGEAAVMLVVEQDEVDKLAQISDLENEGFSQSLTRAIVEAHERNAQYLIFDRDGAIEPNLPTFDLED